MHLVPGGLDFNPSIRSDLVPPQEESFRGKERGLISRPAAVNRALHKGADQGRMVKTSFTATANYSC